MSSSSKSHSEAGKDEDFFFDTKRFPEVDLLEDPFCGKGLPNPFARCTVIPTKKVSGASPSIDVIPSEGMVILFVECFFGLMKEISESKILDGLVQRFWFRQSRHVWL